MTEEYGGHIRDIERQIWKIHGRGWIYEEPTEAELELPFPEMTAILYKKGMGNVLYAVEILPFGTGEVRPDHANNFRIFSSDRIIYSLGHGNREYFSERTDISLEDGTCLTYPMTAKELRDFYNSFQSELGDFTMSRIGPLDRILFLHHLKRYFDRKASQRLRGDLEGFREKAESVLFRDWRNYKRKEKFDAATCEQNRPL